MFNSEFKALCLKSLGGFKVDSAFYTSEVDRISAKLVKSNLYPRGCFVAVR